MLGKKMNMYRYAYSDLGDGIKLIYRFLTAPGLTRPELTVLHNASAQPIKVYDGLGGMTEQDFYGKVTSAEFDVLLCVASTDAADTRRVSLILIKELHLAMLNFPFAAGQLSPGEKKLLRLLSE